MPSVDVAGPEDLSEIAAMRAAEGWALHDWLLDIVCGWEDGRIFVVRPDNQPSNSRSPAGAPSRLIAATSAVAYGRVGFVGNVIVSSAHRRQGLGNLLMRAAIEWLAGRGVRVVELDATPDGRPLYRQLGFVEGTLTSVLWTRLDLVDRGRLAAHAATGRITPLTAGNFREVATLDREAFGGDRLGLVERMLRLCDTHAYVTLDAESAASGYLVVRPLDPSRVGLHLGPWVAKSPATACALLAAALNDAETWRLPKDGGPAYVQVLIPGTSRAARDLFASLQLALVQDDLRMRLDLAPAQSAPRSHAQGPSEDTPSPLPQHDWVYGMLAAMVG